MREEDQGGAPPDVPEQRARPDTGRAFDQSDSEDSEESPEPVTPTSARAKQSSQENTPTRGREEHFETPRLTRRGLNAVLPLGDGTDITRGDSVVLCESEPTVRERSRSHGRERSETMLAVDKLVSFLQRAISRGVRYDCNVWRTRDPCTLR